MKKRWRFEINLALFLLVGALLLSAMIGHLFAILFFMVSCLLIYQLYQLSRMDQWLRAGAVGKNPESRGLWRDIYIQIYGIKKSDKRRKKRLSAMVKEFKTLTSALPDAAVVLGGHDVIEWVNKPARQILGLKKSDKGQRLQNFIRNPEFTHFLKSGNESNTFTMPAMEDENILLEFRVVKYGVGMRLLLAHDVTKLKNIERMRKDFVANVSHELRTPLTVLKGYLETLTDIDDGKSPLYSSSFVQMLGQTERMEHLVDDLLMLTRLETKQKKSQCVNVARLLVGICEEADVLNGEGGRIELILDSVTNIYGEEQDLRSAFTNLIVNALKYSEQDSTVKVRWHNTADGLRLDVEDQGEGISAEDIPRITERFYRVDINRSRKMSGTGLGLAIVKHVLVRHKATLNITSILGKGSCFSCLFPVKQVCEDNCAISSTLEERQGQSAKQASSEQMNLRNLFR